MTKYIFAAALFVALATAACTKDPDSAVIAKVNSAKITAGEFRRQLDGLDNYQLQQAVATDPKARKEFLDDLIGIELVVQEAKRQGLDKDPDFKKRVDTYRKEMERQIQNTVRNELFRTLLKKELSDKLNALKPPTDQEVRDFYTKNKDRMVTLTGKKLSFKDVEQQIKNKLIQDKQREVYLEYTKGLKAKAKVAVDDKALDALISAQSPSATLDLQNPQTEKKDEKTGNK